jgi:hypothetical protein
MRLRYNITGLCWLLLLLVPGLASPALAGAETAVCHEEAAEAPAPPAGTCSSNEQCAKDEYCATWFGHCGESGKCSARPTDCVEHGHAILKPVCGCDDKSYDNACLAALAGVNVKSEGACAPPPAG